MKNTKTSESSSNYPQESIDNVADYLSLEEDFLLALAKQELLEIKDINELREFTSLCLDHYFLMKRLNDLLKKRVDAIDFFGIL